MVGWGKRRLKGKKKTNLDVDCHNLIHQFDLHNRQYRHSVDLIKYIFHSHTEIQNLNIFHHHLIMKKIIEYLNTHFTFKLVSNI